MDSTLNHTKPGFRLGMFGGSELGGMDYSVGAGIDAISTSTSYQDYRHCIKTIKAFWAFCKIVQAYADVCIWYRYTMIYTHLTSYIHHI